MASRCNILILASLMQEHPSILHIWTSPIITQKYPVIFSISPTIGMHHHHQITIGSPLIRDQHDPYLVSIKAWPSWRLMMMMCCCQLKEIDHVIAYRCNHFSAHALFTDSTMGVHTKWDVKRRER